MKAHYRRSKSILLVLLCCISCNAFAQKVSSTQQGSVWAPQGIKIDGKLTEWGTALQAYNKTVKLWYTIANDDKYLYLAIRSDDLDYNPKILAGGISLTINTADKKKDKGAYVVTFPIISRAGGGGRGGRGGGRRGGFGGGQDQDKPDTVAVVAQQRQTLATSKEISAIGFKEITDTLISVYNEYGMKAAASISDKGVYTAELAIPLSMLNIPADQKEIAYNIKVNGLEMQMKNISVGGGGGGRVSISGNGGGFGGGGGGFGGFGGRGTPDADDITVATDFWAKYTIAVNTGK
jgi:hypothetical protein